MKKKINYLVFPIVGALILLSSCAKKMHFGTSVVSPGATGIVKVKKDANGNYALNISITHLAPSQMLTPPKKTYVIWLTTPTNDVRRIGQLKSSSGIISKAYRASLKTVTVFEPSKIFITAEDDALTDKPRDTVVLETVR